MKVTNLLILFLLKSCATHDQPTDVIRTTMLSRLAKYRQCYHESDSYFGNRHLEKTGGMRVAFTIIDTGKVQDIKILKSDFKDPNLDACIIGQLKYLQFNKLQSGHKLEVSQPLAFNPGQK